MKKISVIIPVYKQVDLFIKNLKTNLPYLGSCEIIIVNDDPASQLPDVSSYRKDIKVINNARNVGFAQSIHNGVHVASGDYIFLLNSDVILQNELFINTLHRFETDSQLFAVAFAQKQKDGSVSGKNTLFWHSGLMKHKGISGKTSGITAWAEGGSSLFDKKKFNELDGFNPVYAPFYWEDIDLSYRAWKKGYSVYFDRTVEVYHEHESTIGAFFSRKYINTIAIKNQFLFVWNNITDITLLIKHLIMIPYNIVYFMFKKRPEFMLGFLRALPFLFTTLVKKKNSRHIQCLSDKSVLDILQKIS